jgi:hypothetical protein
MNRKHLWAVFAIGLLLVIAPLAMLLPTKASAGEDMLTGFPGRLADADLRIRAVDGSHGGDPRGAPRAADAGVSEPWRTPR